MPTIVYKGGCGCCNAEGSGSSVSGGSSGSGGECAPCVSVIGEGIVIWEIEVADVTNARCSACPDVYNGTFVTNAIGIGAPNDANRCIWGYFQTASDDPPFDPCIPFDTNLRGIIYAIGRVPEVAGDNLFVQALRGASPFSELQLLAQWEAVPDAPCFSWKTMNRTFQFEDIEGNLLCGFPATIRVRRLLAPAP